MFLKIKKASMVHNFHKQKKCRLWVRAMDARVSRNVNKGTQNSVILIWLIIY